MPDRLTEPRACLPCKGRYSIAQSRQVAEVKRRNLTAAEVSL